MAEEHVSIGNDREGKPIHELGTNLNTIIGNYQEQHPDTTIVFVGSDNEGYVFGSVGNNSEDIAKALLGAATHDEIVKEAISIMVTWLITGKM